MNSDFPGSDHFGYWHNRAEVMSRVVALVSDDALTTAQIDPQFVAFPQTEIAEIGDTVEAAVLSSGAHRVAVLRRLAPVFVGGLLFLILLRWAPDAGRWVLGRDSLLGIEPLGWRGHQLDGAFPNELFGVNVRPIRELLAGSLLLGFLGLILAQVLTLFVDLGRWVRQGGSVALVLVPAFFVVAALGLAIFGYTVSR